MAAVAPSQSASQPRLKAVQRLDEIFFPVDESGDDTRGVQFVAVAVADDSAVRLPALFHGEAGFLPIRWVVSTEFANSGHDVCDFAFRIDCGRAGVEDFVDVGFDERGGDHCGEKLRGLRWFAVDRDVRVMDAETGGRGRHRGRDEAERFADELARDIEIGPGVEADVAGPRRLDAEVHQVAGEAVGGEDATVDVTLPEGRDVGIRKKVFAAF